MTRKTLLLQSLSPEKIDNSAEIEEWLSQFSEDQRHLAKLLLSRLQFVSRDVYATWLEQAVSEIMDSASAFALYSVRKLEQDNDNVGKSLLVYWDQDGEPIIRPGKSLGSEDLVYSLISNLTRANRNKLLDHPSLLKLKENRVHNYILIDDAIGSGDRVSDFINTMLNHPTFLSWWSLGWIKIYVISFARSQESEKNIITKIKGSDHSKRKFRKSSKIEFISYTVYQQNLYQKRWGENYYQLIELCKKQTKILAWARLGYGEIFSNIIFYHSVPNNIPGLIWFVDKKNKWKALMPGRAIPSWLMDLLEIPKEKFKKNTKISKEILDLLLLIKKGVRNIDSIAQRLGIDSRYAKKLLKHAIDTKLVTSGYHRLTPSGLNIVHQSSKNISLQLWDYSMYIPSSWCAEQ